MSSVNENSEKGPDAIASSLIGPDCRQIRDLYQKPVLGLGGGETRKGQRDLGSVAGFFGLSAGQSTRLRGALSV